MKRTFCRIAGLFLASISAAMAAEPQLYETGPSEESAYVRFVNATDQALDVTSSRGSAKVSLPVSGDGRVSRFFSVKAGTRLSATVQSDGHKAVVDVTGKPWEYITVVVLPGGATQLKSMLVRETPEDFNAMRSSVALFNLDAACTGAIMQGGAKHATILDNVKPFSVQRRLVNPVRLTATVGCGANGMDMDMSQLQAGERYSVFLLTLKNARQAFFVRDVN